MPPPVHQKTIFISRTLRPDSPFLQAFSSQPAIRICAESLVDFQPIPFDHLPPCDWIFFSSQQGVRFFFDTLRKNECVLPPHLQWGTLGDGTSQTLRSYGKTPDFAGNGQPDQVGTAFAIITHGQRVLFPAALHSRKSIQAFLPPETTYIDLPVYSNTPKPTIQIPVPDLLVFTSPMNVAAYFAVFPQHTCLPAIAIGESTRTALLSYSLPSVYMASTPSESALAQLALQMLA